MRRNELKTHLHKAGDPTGTLGSIHQPDAKSDVLEFTMQAGRKTLVEGVRTSFVPVGGRHHMESERHHMVTYQQIQNREDKRESQKHGEKRLVLRDFHERTHNHDGSLKTKHPTVLELLARFPAETNEEMILTDENIGQMPKHMEIMRHITKVDLTNNKIKSLSEGIAEIEGLKELILQDNLLVELPRTLQHLTNLQILNARSNKLTHLPEMLGLKSLRDLNIADNDIEVINDSVQKLSQLTVIDVRYCQIKEFPAALCDLQENLCTIHFDYNFILNFPKPIGRLGGLRSLNMSKNEIKTLPVGCIEYMTGLTHLDMSQNGLQDIPQTIGINQGLRELILNNNKITLAPRSLVALTGLVILNLACNEIKRVPEITTLTCLTELRLENNCLERLPVRLWQLTRLQVLEARGNDNLHTPPLSIAYQGMHRIQEWLKEEDKRECQSGLFDKRLREVMMLIVEVFPDKEALHRSFNQADVDGSGTMTLRELDEWIKSLGITNLTFQDVQFLGNAMDKDHSGFVEAEEIKHLYERFRNEKVIKEEEAEEMDEEYLKRARAALIDEEMKEAAESAAREAEEAKRKFEERRKAREAKKAAAAADAVK